MVKVDNREGHGMLKNEELKQRKLTSGFSYLEVVIALSITATTALGLMQITLQQSESARQLSAELQSQLLQLDIQNRLKVNKKYILEWQNNALYFVTDGLQSCDTSVTNKCHVSRCSDEQLAELDILELSCKAKDAGLIHQMELPPISGVNRISEIIISIWLTPELCRSQKCKLDEQRLWL